MAPVHRLEGSPKPYFRLPSQPKVYRVGEVEWRKGEVASSSTFPVLVLLEQAFSPLVSSYGTSQWYLGRVQQMAPPKGKAKNDSTSKSSTPSTPSSSAPPPRRKANIVKSGNAGSSKPAPPPLEPGQTAPPPPLFPLGYKTPLSLLSERCQKNGWERPSVDPKKNAGGTWSASVTLKRKDPKNGGFETVYMKPPPAPSPIAVEKSSAMEAK